MMFSGWIIRVVMVLVLRLVMVLMRVGELFVWLCWGIKRLCVCDVIVLWLIRMSCF